MSSLNGFKVPPSSIFTLVSREYTTSLLRPAGVAAAVEGILFVSEAAFVLSESEGADWAFDEEESSVQPFVFPDEEDPFFIVVTGSEDEMAVDEL